MGRHFGEQKGMRSVDVSDHGGTPIWGLSHCSSESSSHHFVEAFLNISISQFFSLASELTYHFACRQAVRTLKLDPQYKTQEIRFLVLFPVPIFCGLGHRVSRKAMTILTSPTRLGRDHVCTLCASTPQY